MKQLKDITHEHPLIPTEDHRHQDIICGCCEKQIIRGSSLYCCRASSSDRIENFCDRIFMHKKCAELPETLPKHPAHLIHPLTLKLEELILQPCSVCRETISLMFSYRCDDCKFFACLRCASHEQIKHMSHEHTLIFNENHTKDDAECYGCNKPITRGDDSVYSCITTLGERSSCHDFFLHKTCVELPPQLKYPMHPRHHLTLYSRPQMGWRICNACRVDWNWFIYQCRDCKFNICLTCAFKDCSSINHPSHKQHSLSLMNRQASFECDACSSKAKDSSYSCDSCPFWIHKSCAPSPATFISSFHKDPLLLDYSLPQKYHKFLPFCSICEKVLNPMHWLYHSPDYSFSAHIRCAKSARTDSRSNNQDENEYGGNTDLIRCPLMDEPSMDAMVQQFVKTNCGFDDDDYPTTEHNCRHWAHKDHPLFLLDQLKISNTSDEMMDPGSTCEGCLYFAFTRNRKEEF